MPDNSNHMRKKSKASQSCVKEGKKEFHPLCIQSVEVYLEVPNDMVIGDTHFDLGQTCVHGNSW